MTDLDARSANPAETRVPREAWEWFGVAGHFIAADRCRFHLATVVGPWLVSTVGEMPQRLDDSAFEEIALDHTYETMVFPVSDERCTEPDCDCGQPIVTEWAGLERDLYNRRGDAQRGHLAMCEKWSRARPEGRAS